MKLTNKYNEKTFEKIKHVDEFENEYWEARELMIALEYQKWENFHKVIKNAMMACELSKYNVDDHFPEVRKLSNRANNAQVVIKDYQLSRYACYLIVQNADPKKEIVALGQTYFAIQTRKQEISEFEYSLNKTAIKVGVKNLDKFHNTGYKRLYNGETADDIAKRKKLRYREEILDNMGSVELAANLFRITQTEQKLKRDNIKGENKANQTHYEVGKKIRKTIKELGGTMPENLPTPQKSLKEIERERKLIDKN